jgi:hypothetical protein
MSSNTLPESETPNYFRNCTNVGGAAIVAKLLVKISGATNTGGDVASAAADKPFGVAVEDIAVGATKSIRVAGPVVATSGGVLARGDYVTADASGRGIATTTAGNGVWGRALTPTSGANQDFLLEMAPGKY